MGMARSPPAHARAARHVQSTWHLPSPNTRQPHSPCLQAIQKRPKLQSILKEANCSAAYLWRQAKKADPTLTMKNTTAKPEFTEEEKKERFDFCINLLSQPPEWIKAIVWEDESSVPFCPMPMRVIGHKGEEALFTDPRIPADKRKIPWIHYCMSTCWATGLLRMDILSYTTDADDPIQYQVSAPMQCCPRPAHLSALHSIRLSIAASVVLELVFGAEGGQSNCSVNLLFPLAAVLVVQPQQAAALLPCCLVLAGIRCMLCLRCSIKHVLIEVLRPIHFNFQPALLCAAGWGLQQDTEVESTKGAPQHLGLSYDQLHAGVPLQQLICIPGTI